MQAISIIIKLIAAQLISFYSLSLNDTNGQPIPFSSFQGKKVLIVNTGINTADSVQYGKLEQLYQKHKDSLVIIAVPSDDFGHAPVNNDSIRNFVYSHYNIHYILAAKASVKGASVSSLYNWLANQSQNGSMSIGVKNDFYKYLINNDGLPVGIFNKSVDPMSDEVQNAIIGN
jgi:glutathione peroxidase